MLFIKTGPVWKTISTEQNSHARTRREGNRPGQERLADTHYTQLTGLVWPGGGGETCKCAEQALHSPTDLRVGSGEQGSKSSWAAQPSSTWSVSASRPTTLGMSISQSDEGKWGLQTYLLVC